MWFLEVQKMVSKYCQEAETEGLSYYGFWKRLRCSRNPKKYLKVRLTDEKLIRWFQIPLTGYPRIAGMKSFSKPAKATPLVFLPIAMDPLCDWAQLEPWVIAPNLFIKS